MNPSNDNEIEEQNIQAARSIMQEPPESLTAELEPNPPISSIIQELTSGIGRVVTIQCQEDA